MASFVRTSPLWTVASLVNRRKRATGDGKVETGLLTCSIYSTLDTPRTLTILGGMLLVLVYVAMTPEVDDTTTNVKM